MYKAGVIGDAQTVMGFKAIGLVTAVARNTDEARAALARLAKGSNAVIYITESLAENMQAEIAKYDDTPDIAIIPIPSRDGILGIGRRGLHSAVERAVGADILK